MKKILALAFALAVVLISNSALAQEYAPPQNAELKVAADYAKYEPEVLKCIDFLETSPLGDIPARKRANWFFLRWLGGAPNVMVQVPSYVSDLVEKNNDLLVIFACGWTKYSLQHPEDKDVRNCHLAGLRDIIKVYTGNEGVNSSDAVDEIVDAEKEGTLGEWLDSHLESK